MPDFLGFDDRPAKLAQRSALVQLRANCPTHATSARLFAGALASDRRLADDHPTRHHDNAPTPVRRPVATRGKTTHRRRSSRDQSLNRLKVERITWARLLPDERALVRPKPDHSKVDIDLDEIRNLVTLLRKTRDGSPGR